MILQVILWAKITVVVAYYDIGNLLCFHVIHHYNFFLVVSSLNLGYSSALLPFKKPAEFRCPSDSYDASPV